MHQRTKLLLVALIALISITLVPRPTHADLLKESQQVLNSNNADPLLLITCDEGGNATFGTPATTTQGMKACATYTSTSSHKTGAIKVLINNTEKFINLYDGPV